MSNALHYKSNLRDIFFNLFEVLEVQRTTLGQGEFANMDEATARDLLENLEKFASNELAASFIEGDRTPLKFDSSGNAKRQGTFPPRGRGEEQGAKFLPPPRRSIVAPARESSQRPPPLPPTSSREMATGVAEAPAASAAERSPRTEVWLSLV